jgi:hypothetical protein
MVWTLEPTSNPRYDGHCWQDGAWAPCQRSTFTARAFQIRMDGTEFLPKLITLDQDPTNPGTGSRSYVEKRYFVVVQPR